MHPWWVHRIQALRTLVFWATGNWFCFRNPNLTSKQQSVNVDTKLAFVAKQKQSTLLASVWWTQYPDLISHKGHEGDLKIVWLTHPVIYLTKAPQQHLCILPKGHYNVILTFKDIFHRSQDNASGVEGKILTSTHIHWVFGAVATKNGIWILKFWITRKSLFTHWCLCSKGREQQNIPNHTRHFTTKFNNSCLV